MKNGCSIAFVSLNEKYNSNCLTNNRHLCKHAVIQDDAITRPEVKHASEGRVLVNISGIFIN